MITTSSTAPTLSQARRRARILIIEDDSVLADVIRELLVDEGFDVSVCNRGQDGYASVVAGHPDIVMLDLRFGDEEYGWRILDLLMLNPATRCIPVIVSSAAESLQIQAPVLLAQNGHFVLPKPFDLDVLLGTVETALAQSTVGTPEAGRNDG